jgi:hypothetical protein
LDISAAELIALERARRAAGFIVSRLNGFVLDLKGAEVKKGTKVVTWPKKSENNMNQKWYAFGSRRRRASPDACGRAATEPGGRMRNGGRMWTPEGYIVSQLSNLVLEIDDAKVKKGATIHVMNKF